MPSISARALALSAVVSFGGLSVACADATRCDVALAHAEEARAQAAQREQQIAWLSWSQAQLAAQVQRGALASGNDAEREALRRRVELLEAENAALAARAEQAERRLVVESGRAAEGKRRLDPTVPYALTGFLAKPRDTGKQEASLLRRATRPSRRLDPMVPYGSEGGAATLGPDSSGAPVKRTLDEEVPY
ncbi:MAG: hypothetical protein QM820_63845 [Minicystis sp.]